MTTVLDIKQISVGTIKCGGNSEMEHKDKIMRHYTDPDAPKEPKITDSNASMYFHKPDAASLCKRASAATQREASPVHRSGNPMEGPGV